MTTEKFDPKKCSLSFYTKDGIRIALPADSVTYEPMHSGSGDRRKNTTSAVTPQLTIAQSIRRSSDPYRAAVASFTRREVPHGQSKHVYYFEDRSFLTFEVTYTAVEDGAS